MATAARDYDHERLQETGENALVWKACRNAGTPFCQLPPELLSHIFQLVSRNGTYGMERYTRYTHVCKHWRTVALNCKNLWNHLDGCFARPAYLAQEMVLRSKDAPLIVECRGEFRGRGTLIDIGVLTSVLSQVERLKIVELENVNDPDMHFPTLLSQWTNSTAPILEKLKLTNMVHGLGWFTSKTLELSKLEKSHLPDGFLKGGAPFLRHLSLSRCGIAWERAPLSGSLTHLRLFEDSRYMTRRPTPSGFVDSLKAMPLLQELELECFTPAPGAIPQVPYLPPSALKTLKIKDFAQQITHLFRVVEVRDHVAVDIEFIGEDEIFDNLGQALAQLKSSLGKERRKAVLTELWDRSDGSDIFEFLFEISLEDEERSAFDLVLTFNGHAMPLEYYALLHRHFGLLQLKTLQYHDSWTSRFGEPEWFNFSLLMPNLERIAFCGTNIYTFIDFVNGDPALPNPSHSPDTVETHQFVPTRFPALSEIWWIEPDMRDDRVESMQCLVDVLQKRLHSTRPITRLKLGDNDLSYWDEAIRILEAAPELKARFEEYSCGDVVKYSFK